MKNRKLLILELLNSETEQMVEGRTRLQKLLFLIQKRLEEEGIEMEKGHDFIAYDYGPFSKGIYEDIEFLIDRGLVSERIKTLDDGVVKYNYELTNAGREEISESSELSVERQEIINEIRDNFGNENLRDLIEYVYSKYPEYAENSVLY